MAQVLFLCLACHLDAEYDLPKITMSGYDNRFVKNEPFPKKLRGPLKKRQKLLTSYLNGGLVQSDLKVRKEKARSRSPLSWLTEG